MNLKNVNLALCAAMVALVVTSSLSADLFWAGIGPSWRRVLLDSEKPASMHVEAGYGRVFGEMVGIGAEVDFSWNHVSEDSSYVEQVSTDETETVRVTLSEDKRYVFPLSVFLSVDPIPQFLVHPVIKATYGLDMMVLSSREYDYSGGGDEPDINKAANNGFYYGSAGSISADAVVSFVETVGFFAGVEYEWAKLRKNKRGTSNQYYQPEPDGWGMSGVGLRAGFRFAF